MSYIVSVYLPHHDFEPDFTKMAGTVLDLDISLDREAFIGFSPQLPIDSNSRRDYHETFYHPSELLVQFTSILVRLYVNCCLNCMLDLDLTVNDEKILIENIYLSASSLMYDFFDTNYRFFYDFFDVFFERYSSSYCYSLSKKKKHVHYC